MSESLVTDTTEEGADPLLIAVRKLTEVVSTLTRTISEDYPKRQELEGKYATRDNFRRTVTIFAITTVIGIIASGLITMSVISHCFLQGNFKSDACQIIPGYSGTVKRSQRLQTQRDASTATAKELKRQLAVTEQRLALIESQMHPQPKLP